MSSSGIPIADAACELGKSAATIRRWITAGAPTVTLGREGRGNGSLVSVAALRAWRAGGTAHRDDSETPQMLARAFHAAYATDVPGHFRPAHAVVGLRDRDAAAYLVHVYQLCAQQLIGHTVEADRLPQEIRDLIKIAE
jgi:hypothetical protein